MSVLSKLAAPLRPLLVQLSAQGATLTCADDPARQALLCDLGTKFLVVAREAMKATTGNAAQDGRRFIAGSHLLIMDSVGHVLGMGQAAHEVKVELMGHALSAQLESHFPSTRELAFLDPVASVPEVDTGVRGVALACLLRTRDRYLRTAVAAHVGFSKVFEPYGGFFVELARHRGTLAEWNELHGREVRVLKSFFGRQPGLRLAYRTAEAPLVMRLPCQSRPITRVEAEAMMPELLALQQKVYEPARQETRESILRALEPGGIAVIVEAIGRDGSALLVGCTLACPLEAVDHVDGPMQDPNRGKCNTLYSIDVTVDPDYRGRGLGEALKRGQIECARKMKNGNELPRYQFITSRNRLDGAGTAALEMAAINGALGAVVLAEFDHQYEGNGLAQYVQITLNP